MSMTSMHKQIKRWTRYEVDARLRMNPQLSTRKLERQNKPSLCQVYNVLTNRVVVEGTTWREVAKKLGWFK